MTTVKQSAQEVAQPKKKADKDKEPPVQGTAPGNYF